MASQELIHARKIGVKRPGLPIASACENLSCGYQEDLVNHHQLYSFFSLLVLVSIGRPYVILYRSALGGKRGAKEGTEVWVE